MACIRGTYAFRRRGGGAEASSASRLSTAGLTREPGQGAQRCGPSSKVRQEDRGPIDHSHRTVPDSMGFKTFGFAAGGKTSGSRIRRQLGIETNGVARTSAIPAIANWQTRSARPRGPDLREPGRPGRRPDPIAAVKDIRETSPAWR